MTMKRTIFLISLLWGMTTASGMAADFDGSKTLICSTIAVSDCDEILGCEQVSPKFVNLPRFLRIDFQNKLIKGEDRSTAIQNMSQAEGQIFLQGVQGERAWSVLLSTETGDITGTVTGDGFGFVVFGACTTLESLGS